MWFVIGGVIGLFTGFGFAFAEEANFAGVFYCCFNVILCLFFFSGLEKEKVEMKND